MVRGLRRRELFRVSVADLLGLADVRTVGDALTGIATVTIEAALRTAVNKIEMESREPLPTRRRSSRWAGSAGTSSATAATPT